MENKEIRRANMLALADQNGGLQGLADKTKTDAKYLSQVKNRWQGRGMGDDVARRIEEELGKERGWMDTLHAAPGADEVIANLGISPLRTWEHESDLPEGEYAFIPRLDVRLSAGHGAEQGTLGLQLEIDFIKDQRPLAFRTDWIRRNHLRPNKLASMTASGDSGEPRIHDGDALVVDTSQCEIVDGRLYALWYDGGERVKRLYLLPGGGLLIRSDNEAKYPPLTLKAEQAESVRIIGRVVHVAGEGGL